MSDTAQLFILAGVWSLIAAALVRLLPNWPARIGVFALLVGIPFWELPYGYYNFTRLCEEHGGMKVFEKLVPQQSVCADFPLDTSAGQFLKSGLKIVETRDASGRIRRVSGGSTGDNLQKDEQYLSSRYCVSQAFVQGLPWRIQRNEHLVVSASDRRLVARFSDFVWFGTWWQQQALPVLGRGGECRHGNAVRTIAATLVTGNQ